MDSEFYRNPDGSSTRGSTLLSKITYRIGSGNIVHSPPKAEKVTGNVPIASAPHAGTLNLNEDVLDFCYPLGRTRMNYDNALNAATDDKIIKLLTGYLRLGHDGGLYPPGEKQVKLFSTRVCIVVGQFLANVRARARNPTKCLAPREALAWGVNVMARSTNTYAPSVSVVANTITDRYEWAMSPMAWYQSLPDVPMSVLLALSLDKESGVLSEELFRGIAFVATSICLDKSFSEPPQKMNVDQRVGSIKTLKPKVQESTGTMIGTDIYSLESYAALVTEFVYVGLDSKNIVNGNVADPPYWNQKELSIVGTIARPLAIVTPAHNYHGQHDLLKSLEKYMSTVKSEGSKDLVRRGQTYRQMRASNSFLNAVAKNAKYSTFKSTPDLSIRKPFTRYAGGNASAGLPPQQDIPKMDKEAEEENEREEEVEEEVEEDERNYESDNSVEQPDASDAENENHGPDETINDDGDATKDEGHNVPPETGANDDDHPLSDIESDNENGEGEEEAREDEENANDGQGGDDDHDLSGDDTEVVTLDVPSTSSSTSVGPKKRMRKKAIAYIGNPIERLVSHYAENPALGPIPDHLVQALGLEASDLEEFKRATLARTKQDKKGKSK